jgi:hypothetical protein
MKKLTPQQKLLIHAIMGPDPRHIKLMFMIHGLTNCDQVLHWLIKKDYIGKNLGAWIERDHGGSWEQAFHWLKASQGSRQFLYTY